MELTNQILQDIETRKQEAFELLVELAQIPAPSNHEEKRADFCKRYLEKMGAKGVYIDEARNVIFPVGCTDTNDLIVVMAHSDVVFPDVEPLPLKIEDGRIYCPGVGDDTANVAALMTFAGYIAANDLLPKNAGMLIVINSGEEGLGNLKGSRKIMETFGPRVREFITLDAFVPKAVNKAVGSRRYRIEVRTEGGHSYNNFGRTSAIAVLASIIDQLYAVQVPPFGKTTYNVGTIQGGTSVNTIAQYAQMLYEFRSDDPAGLSAMQNLMDQILNRNQREDATISVTLVGDRPCGIAVDEAKMQSLIDRAQQSAKRRYGQELAFYSGSTDCNIPLSLGIPAICVGCCRGLGAHTREEYVEMDSLHEGLNFLFDFMLQYF